MKPQFKLYPLSLLRSEIVRSSTVLITGTVAAQLVSILLQPVLRRLFTPESFGILSAYLSIVGMLVILCSLRYDDTIVLPRSDKESVNLVGLSIGISFLFNLAVFIIFLLLGTRLKTFLNLPEGFPAKVLYIIPAGAFLSSTSQTLYVWLIRKRKFIPASVNKLVRRSSEGISQITFALLKTPSGLIYSDIIGQTANITIAAYQSGRNGMDLRLVSKSKLKYVIKKYSDFPRFNLLPAFMSSCSYLLPPIFILKFFSSETAGFFDLSRLLLSIPMALIASSISNVLLQRVSERYNKRETLLSELKPVLAIVGILSVAEVVLILLFGEKLFTIVFGSQWLVSGQISRIMVWSFALNFLVSSFTSIFVSMRRIKTYSIWQLIYFISILSLLFFRNIGFTDFLRIYVGIEVFCSILAATIMITVVYKYETTLAHATD